mmetsp:Transcript_18544/g.54416  ORF Transcript_18544/g.54416 Transcript_18544/m.54416 type:complete len:223 (+) Transcript_18544:1599-2267(+)
MRRAEHVRLSAALRRGRPPGAVCRPRQRRGGVDHPRLPLRALGRLPAAGVPGREDLPDHQGGALGDPRCHREPGGRRGGHRPADWKGCGAVGGVARAAEARALLCARALAQQPLAEDAAVGAAAALARRLHRHPGRHGGVGRRGAPVHRRHRRHLPAAPSLHPLRRAVSLDTSACEAGAICCSALFVLVPWDAARLQVLLKMSRAERAVGPSAEEKDNSARS